MGEGEGEEEVGVLAHQLAGRLSFTCHFMISSKVDLPFF